MKVGFRGWWYLTKFHNWYSMYRWKNPQWLSSGRQVKIIDIGAFYIVSEVTNEQRTG